LIRPSLGKDLTATFYLGGERSFYSGPHIGYPDERINAMALIKQMGKKIPPKTSAPQAKS